MRKPQSRDLRELERQSTDEAARLVMEGDVDGAMLAFKRAELAQGLLDHRRHASWVGVLVPVVVAILCGVVASFLAVYRIPTTTVAATIRSTGVSFTPRSPLEWQGDAKLQTETFRFEKFAGALAPPEPDEMGEDEVDDDSGRGALHLGRQGQAAFKALSVQKGAKVALEVDRAGLVQIITSRGPADARLLFWGRVEVEREVDGQMMSASMNVIDVPETLYLNRTDPGIISSVLAFDPRPALAFPVIEVEAVSFSKEVLDDGASTFVSTIVDGRVSIIDTDQHSTLGPNQSLTLVGFQGQIRRLIVDDQIELALSGTADDIIVKTGNIERTLVPTYLGFMYQNQQIALIWSGVAFLWGMLWSVGRFITRQS